MFFDAFRLFPFALIGGILAAIVMSFFGVFVVLRRLAFIGPTLSQAAACGIAAAFLWNLDSLVTATAAALAAAALVARHSNEETFPRDSLLAAVFVAASSLSVLFAARSPGGLEQVESLLFGDLILTSFQDIKILGFVLFPAGLILLLFVRPVIYTFADSEGARSLGIRTGFWVWFFYGLLAFAVSAASKVTGMLLISCYLVVPALTGLLLAGSLLGVILTAVASGALSTLLGLWLAYHTDLPANQVVCAICTGFLVSAGLLKGMFRFRRR